ncbi:uncharacterized protein LOC120267812 isoform X1 [Dioscorea cayenensis subsp. rotundata]|uniref:Uncharacterized protein LOC120267812 isoform X1 n=2 Tax=Dioscorea cayennensis subsp. rotundata TaxID=55577 RepID=A0AB40BXR7_DIOCR|nr:uncharacterized protein LOC120267812 isoform X1 [Dioscorea cayenensis subsp. rotundata]
MATAFLLWPAAPSSSPERSHIPDQEPDPGQDPTPLPIAKPKARKAGGKQPAPKRPPQRGLGVAQLERLRLQERWSKITDPEFHPSPPQLPPYSPPAPNFDGVPPVWNDHPPGSPGYCYIQRYRALNPVIPPYGSLPTGRSVLHDQYAMDRIRFSGSGLQAASPPSVIEPPSNQMPQCLSSHCELCTRNQFSGEDHGAAAKVVHQETEPDTTSTREMEYYEFLPHCGGVSHGDSEFAHRTAEDGSSSSPDFIDLSLKLSF